MASLGMLFTRLGRRTLLLWSKEAWGEKLLEPSELIHSEGLGIERAYHLLPAGPWTMLILGAIAKVALPRMWQSLVSWRLLVPPRLRPLLPFEAVMLIPHDLIVSRPAERSLHECRGFRDLLPAEDISGPWRQTLRG